MLLYFFTKGNFEILCIPVPCNDYERWRAKKNRLENRLIVTQRGGVGVMDVGKSGI